MEIVYQISKQCLRKTFKSKLICP